MALVRLDPSREIEAFQTDMNRLFDSFFRSDSNSAVRRWVPATDLVEEGDDLVLRLDLPGMTEDDVSVEVDANVLTISGERRDTRESAESGFYRIERSFGKFSRSFTLPEGVEPDAIAGEFDRGVLELRVPKPAEQKPHRVEIGAKDAGPAAIEGSSTET